MGENIYTLIEKKKLQIPDRAIHRKMAQENNQKRTLGFMQGQGLAWLNLNSPNGGCFMDGCHLDRSYKLKKFLGGFSFSFQMSL